MEKRLVGERRKRKTLGPSDPEDALTLAASRFARRSQVVAVKAPGFGERKTSYLEDIAILTGGTMVKDELGVSLEKSGEEVLGKAAKVRGGERSGSVRERMWCVSLEKSWEQEEAAFVLLAVKRTVRAILILLVVCLPALRWL